MKFTWVMFLFVFLAPSNLYAGKINYRGSSTVAKFIKDASEVYKTSSFTISTKRESSGGESCAINNKCDVGGVARAVNQEFLDKGVVTTMIGKDALAVIVNLQNPVKGLSSAQLKGIFTGKIKNWSEVGGPDLGIKPLIVRKGSATRSVFQMVILGGSEYEGHKVIKPDIRIISTVSSDKAAIGHISFAFVKDNQSVRPLVVDGQEPNVNNPAYAISRPLFLVTNGAPKGDVKDFIDWSLSSNGQNVIKERFVGVK